MRVHRFFLPGWSEQTDHEVRDEAIIHQWLHVFRSQVGDRLILCDGQNGEAQATMIAIQKRAVTLRIGKRATCQTELSRKIILGAALLKRENFEWVAQKATELGVAEIQPLITDRTIKNEIKQMRIEAIIKEAMEQSGRGYIPHLHGPLSLKEFLENTLSSSCLIFDAAGSSVSAAISLVKADPLTVVIGPEGGWSETERVFFQEKGYPLIRLGTRVLRAETAAVAALSVVTNLIES